MTDATRPLLSSLGQIYVTLAAALEYARPIAGESEGMRDEEARRELTELLVESARVREEHDGQIVVRARSKTLGVDVTAHVVREPPLLVVVHVSVRVEPASRPIG